MPKIKIRPDVPIWDELVVELGDPRPYEPTVDEFTTITVTDESCLDLDKLADALSLLDRAVEDAESALADLLSEGHAVLDETFDLDDVDDALTARAAWRHAKLRTDQTVVIPIWPGTDAAIEDNVEEVQS